MKNKLSTIAAATVIGLAGVTSVVVAGAALAPATATATTEEGTGAGEQAFLADRLQRIKDALAGLVSDGTITQDQADRVAETLNDSDALRGGHAPGGHGFGGHGGFGIGLDAAAEALGVTEDELGTALADGSTLAEVAQQEGVALDTLVDALVATVSERLDQAVTDGRVTPERRDEIVAELPDRIAEAVEQEMPRLGHHGPRGEDATDDATGETQTSSFDA